MSCTTAVPVFARFFRLIRQPFATLLMAGFAFGTFALTGCGTGVSTAVQTVTGSSLQVSATSLDFGSSDLGGTVATATVTFSNSGTQSATLGTPAISGTDFQVTSSTCAANLAAGKSCSMTIAFTPTIAGVRTGSVSVTSGSQTASVALHGIGLRPVTLTLNKPAYSFADTVVGSTSPLQQLALTNTGDVSTPIAVVTQGGFQQVSSTCGESLDPQSTCSVGVAFVPAAKGMNAGTFTAKGGTAAVTATLTGNGLMPAHVQASPSVISFPDVKVGGQSPAISVVLTNSGDASAALSSLQVSRNFTLGTNTCAASLPAQASCTVGVVFSPGAAGAISGQLTITANGQPLQSALSGNGVALHHLTIAAATAPSVRVQGTLQLLAQLDGVTTSAVAWSIVPAASGSGTITPGGVYTAPAAVPSTGSVTARATLSSDATLTADLSLTVIDSLPTLQNVVPATITPGVTTTVHVTGSGLSNVDSVFVSGVSTAVTKISSTEFSFSAAPPAWAVAPLSLVAHVPGSAGGNSNALSLALTDVPVTYDAAVRFAQQATMGTTPDQIAQVQRRGFSKWIDWQVSTPVFPYEATQVLTYRNYMANTQISSYALRQRVTMALKQVYTFGASDPCFVTQCGPYWEARLQQDAFGNLRTLLYDVAISPLMGSFLQNARNFAYQPWTGDKRPNANFAREFMQLMTIGTYRLNRDGSPVLDANGNTIPAYDESNVIDSAAAMSGWTWADIGYFDSLLTGNPLLPMVPKENYHDPLAKNILPGITLPAGQGAAQDMNGVVDALFQHPNLGPFLCRRLIQHLVTSNPSPAYIARIVAVFEDNGAGVRGDMAAIIKAILLDSEARRGDDPSGQYTATETHYMEPVLYVASVVSAAGATYSDDQIYISLLPLGQDLFMSPTVFGAYSPDNKLPDGTFAPEVQLLSDAASLQKVAFVNNIAHEAVPGINVNLKGSPFWNAASPAALIDQMDHFLFHGTMPGPLRTVLNSYISDHSGLTANQMLPDFLVIALNSSSYQVLH